MTNNKKYYPWIVVALLWGVALLNYMDRQMLSTMKSAMMIDITELESATNFGRLMAVFLWIYGLMSPVAGMIADRINRKWLIVGSLFVWSFVTLMMGYSTDFNQIYILRAIMGVSEALYIPAGLSLITDYHQEKTRSLAVGIHMTGLYTGQALGGFGATIAGAYSWETTFHWFGIIGIAYSLVLILFLKEKKDHTVANKLGTRPERESGKSGYKKEWGCCSSTFHSGSSCFYISPHRVCRVGLLKTGCRLCFRRICPSICRKPGRCPLSRLQSLLSSG